MHLIRMIFIILALCLLSSPALAQGSLSPDGSHSNQNPITKALEKGDVYLEKGLYFVDGPTYIPSNRRLLGDEDAIIIVWEGSSQWFTGSTGIISCKESVKDVEIGGFQINGNCINIPQWMANTPGHDKDCEKLIILHGNTGDFADNIKIHDMKLYDSYSDGMYIYYAENIECSNNVISNCQHEGIFWSCVKNGLLKNNDIAGIVSDCMRLDNCINCKVDSGIQYSYSGTHANGAYMHGENGMQIGDAGSSHGYNAKNKPTTTTNIEVCNVTFANCGREAIQLGSNTDGEVYIHDNKYVDVAPVTKDGKPVSYENTPTREMSEKIFSNIFDIFSMDYSTHAGENDTVILPSGVKESKPRNPWTVEQHDLKNSSYTLVYGPADGLSEVQYKVGNKEATHTLMLGENHGSKIIFSNCSIWSGDIHRTGDSLFLEGIVEPEDIEVTCNTVKDSFKPDFKVIQFEQKPRGIFNNFIIFYLSMLGVFLSIPLIVIAILFSKRF